MILKRNGEKGHPCLVPNLNKPTFMSLGIILDIIFYDFFFFWCWDQTQGLEHARQARYHRATSQPYRRSLPSEVSILFYS
jgi:hypothetical protein